MSRKDYIALAEQLNNARQLCPVNSGRYYGVMLAAKHIAIACKRDNDRFDTQRFLQACGFNDESI